MWSPSSRFTSATRSRRSLLHFLLVEQGELLGDLEPFELCRERLLPVLGDPDLRHERVERAAADERLHQTTQANVDRCQFTLDFGSLLAVVVLPDTEPLECLLRSRPWRPRT